jgi:glutathione synthase/RimK-type ligase-like ATP-grasp enzyme
MTNDEVLRFDALPSREFFRECERECRSLIVRIKRDRHAKVFNRAAALRDHPEKLAILEFPQFIGPTLVTRRADDVRAYPIPQEAWSVSLGNSMLPAGILIGGGP